MFRWLIMLAAVVTLAGGTTALAQPPGEPDLVATAADAFRERRFEAAVSLLTGVIESGTLEGERLTEAYWNRGISYSAMGDKARAFATRRWSMRLIRRRVAGW